MFALRVRSQQALKEWTWKLKLYLWPVGNISNYSIIEAGAVPPHTVDVKRLVHAGPDALATAHTASSRTNSFTVGVEIRITNTFIHDDDVGARSDTISVTCGKELTGIDKCQTRKRDREEF